MHILTQKYRYISIDVNLFIYTINLPYKIYNSISLHVFNMQRDRCIDSMQREDTIYFAIFIYIYNMNNLNNLSIFPSINLQRCFFKCKILQFWEAPESGTVMGIRKSHGILFPLCVRGTTWHRHTALGFLHPSVLLQELKVVLVLSLSGYMTHFCSLQQM